MWSLAVFVPGGLIILAIWLSLRAAARRQELVAARAATPRIAASTPSVLQS